MEFDLEGVHVRDKNEFCKLIEQINTDIEFSNYFQKDKPAEERLNMKYLISRYGAIMEKEERKAFREEHNCTECFYFKNKGCKARKKCPLDEPEKREYRRIAPKAACPKDKEGNCPYGNDVGTCFGFCWKKILREHKEAKERCNKEAEKDA